MAISFKNLQDALNFILSDEPYLETGVYPGSFGVNRNALVNNHSALIAAGCKGFLFEQIVKKWTSVTQEQLEAALAMDTSTGKAVITPAKSIYYLPNDLACLLSVSSFGQGEWGEDAINGAASDMDEYFTGKANGPLSALVNAALNVGLVASIFKSDQQKMEKWAAVKNFLLSKANPYQNLRKAA